MKKILLLLFVGIRVVYGQKTNDVNTPLHAMQPNYPVPYGVPSVEKVKATLDRVLGYLDSVTPAQFVSRGSNAVVRAGSVPDTTVVFMQGDFRLTSYEWGVTYAGMTSVGLATGDQRYTDYTRKRLDFLGAAYPAFRRMSDQYPHSPNALRQLVAPHALDDGGALCAAMIKEYRRGRNTDLQPVINHYIDYISTREYRLSDGTLARNRPQKNTLWLDDLFMSVPALAQMGKLTGESKYYEDAVRQVLLFSRRMFNRGLGIYMHGWVEGMSDHPEFHWGRANGWALMAMTELLDVLPEDFKDRGLVLDQLRQHIRGLASFQSGQGFWHQLIDRNDSYLETSATAIYVYCIAKAVDRGWIDAKTYGPMCLLGWNAVSTMVNQQGQVEGTCVGTGMAFDPAFYYYRPVNVYAAHGYGPVLLAGAEIIEMLKRYSFEMNDSAVMLKEK